MKKRISKTAAEKIAKIVRRNFPFKPSYRFTQENWAGVIAYRVPIVLLPYVQLAYRSLGISIKCRYRGPRNHPQDFRSKTQRNQDAIKKFATHFTVYKKG